MQVVSVLSARQAESQRGAVRPYISSLLDKRIVARGPFNATDMLEELRGFHLGDDAIINDYIPVSARRIGEKWVASELGFADVTIATVRLQSLLTEVAYSDTSLCPISDVPLHVLMVIPESDQHTLGGFVAAAQLRRRGASVDVMCGEKEDEVVAHCASGSFDAVMFSCSKAGALDSIGQIVKQTRLRLSRRPVFALGGIVLNYIANVQRLTGVDLVAQDVETVVTYCEQRSILSPKQAVR
ncbi:hypothetical protein CFI11_23830 (plasmid) [Thalassococcus sp. S3]|nr:hypothetical protein CFI11_23830 [Thalassococcus sp. S3]